MTIPAVKVAMGRNPPGFGLYRSKALVYPQT